MPKEYVHDAHPGDGAQPAATISWSKHGGGAIESGRSVAAVQVRVVDTIAEQPDEGLVLTLDRAGCNDLIRKLRRARDGVFGRDE
jgi:hypothetical protein